LLSDERLDERAWKQNLKLFEDARKMVVAQVRNLTFVTLYIYIYSVINLYIKYFCCFMNACQSDFSILL